MSARTRKYVQDEKPPRLDEAQAWLDEATEEQRRRYQAIVAEQEALTGEREGWYTEFLQIIQTKGFNVTGDLRRVITPEEIPEKPERDDAMRVVW